MAYLTYEDYLEYGGTLDETTFDEFAFEAEAEIDWYTFSRLQSVEYTELNPKVKRCMYYLIKLIQEAQIATAIPTADGGVINGTAAGIMSQSNDGVSITYATLSAHDLVERTKDEIRASIQRHLQNVKDSLGRKVLYRGIYPGE